MASRVYSHPPSTEARRDKALPDRRRHTGAAAENVAAQFLETQGLKIVARNYRRRLGELDLIAEDQDVLAIIEVRTRSSDLYGGAAASVSAAKQRRIVRAAAQLLQQRRDYARRRVRFDVIVVRDPVGSAPAVEWIRHAFEATSRP